MIEEATVDCYNESEQVTGWLTMIEDNLAIPFDVTVLGVQVTASRGSEKSDEDVFRDVLSFRGSRGRITAVVANLGDPDDPGRKKALARVRRALRARSS